VNEKNVLKDTLLDVQNLKMYFPVRKGFLHKTYAYCKAVDDVSFAVKQGETFGLVGESGCGKTTTGRCILRMYEPTQGKIIYKGNDISHYTKHQISLFRHEIQIIFQDPYGSLDPRQSIGSIVREPLQLSGKNITKKTSRDRVNELISIVGLDSSMETRYPHELSGGQRQRVGIARALASSPELLICDEPVSALDVSIQAQIINLLEDLQRKLNLTYIFIAHDLALVHHISNNIGVMYLGNIVEITSSEELYVNPLHPYTHALLSAIPIADYDVEHQRKRIVLEKEIPSPINPPSGCPFHPRCSFVMDICKKENPKLIDRGNRHYVACYYVE
jgi:peptide/nickel transport system ATP-binding protein/oligopeptide transport system ATP-binding protein